MIQVGIFTGYFPHTLEESAKVIREHGFNTVQLDLTFKGMDLSCETIDKKKCNKIRDTFRSHNLPISCVSSYTNLVHPEARQRKKNLDKLKKIIEYANECGSPYVVSETGTFNAESDWVHDDKNKTEEGYQECMEVIGDIVDFSRKHGVTFLVETYVNNVIGSIDETLRLFSDIKNKHLGLLMDPTNYFETHNINDMDNVLNQIFNALSHHVVISHAKDVKLAELDRGIQMASGTDSESHNLRGVGSIELPASGLGSLNHKLYLQRLGKDHPNIPLIIEHLEESDVPRAKKFIDDTLLAVGK